jgi:4-diphosphocytidyl-2C-methyl-D-erythritol kinase
VGTKEAYAMYHACEKQDIDLERVIRAVQQGDMEAYVQCAGNDLAPAAMQICPDIARVKTELKNAEIALVTGSGSCLYGVYRDKKTARDDLERLSNLPFVQFVYLAENK